MKWIPGYRSQNVEDRRGLGVRRGVQIGGAGLVLAIVTALVTGDPTALLDVLGGAGDQQGAPTAQGPRSPEEEKQVDQLNLVLDDTEKTWTQLFAQAGRNYRAPHLIFFSGAVESACGYASAAVGPFYCPGDSKAYIDLSFFGELDRKLGAPGDFAQAYVLAHEIGHHVQNLLGVSERVHAQRTRSSETAANELSVRTELQADCYAGVWAHHAPATLDLDKADIAEALQAAAAIGDDTLQRRARGRVMPESFTHGSSEQRLRWFRRGMESGDAQVCDTFGARAL